MVESCDERLLNLEIRIAHQERTIEQLSGVLFEQQQRLDALTQKLKELHQSIQPLVGVDNTGEKPPHY